MNPRRGDLYTLRGGQFGKNRPIVIVSHDGLNGGHSVVAVPFYSQQLAKRRDQKWCAFFASGEGGLDKDSVAKADEISLIDKLHIDLAAGRIGTFNDDQMARLEAAIKWALVID